MISLEDYKKYKEVGVELNTKIMHFFMDKFGKEHLQKGGKLLDMIKGNTFIFDSEDEVSIMQDFMFNEYRINNKTGTEIYKETIGGKNEIEEELLNGLIGSYTSLFRITQVSKENYTLYLEDVLNNKSNIEIMDIGFSQTAKPGYLIFIRLVTCKSFNKTSGMSFVFSDDEEYILRKYKNIYARIKPSREAIKRFVAFFKLKRIEGKTVQYN